jgi:DNA processing protein
MTHAYNGMYLADAEVCLANAFDYAIYDCGVTGSIFVHAFVQSGLARQFERGNPCIVAGMSDACVVVESAAKGGSLITARLSRDYNRDTFAFPGPVGAPYSEGCNHLIRDNQAGLITSAEDFVMAMGWQDDATLTAAQQQGIERQLFPQLNETEARIVAALQKQNDQQINLLTVRTDLPISKLTATLFELEMKGVVKTFAGGIYHLLK